jgi:hypothetical protein
MLLVLSACFETLECSGLAATARQQPARMKTTIFQLYHAETHVNCDPDEKEHRVAVGDLSPEHQSQPIRRPRL